MHHISLVIFVAALVSTQAQHDTEKTLLAHAKPPASKDSVTTASMVIPRVVFAGNPDGHIPADGMLYVNSGYGMFGQTGRNVLLAFEVKR